MVDTAAPVHHQTYSPKSFMNLSNIRQANEWELGNNARMLIDLLHSIEKAQHLFGICRLHKHFEIEDSECVVTTCDDGISFKTRVKPYQSEFLPCLW